MNNEPAEFQPVAPAIQQTPQVQTTSRAAAYAMLCAQLDVLAAPRVGHRLQMPVLPPGVGPDPGVDLAFDDAAETANQLIQYATQQGCGVGFPGYPYLAQLLQRSEYYEPPAVIANELTRNWVRIVSKGGNATDRIEKLEKRFEEMQIRHMFRHCANSAGQFGRVHIFMSFDGQKNNAVPIETKKSGGVKTGSLMGFQPIEATWMTPQTYNSTDPTRKDFYKPERWYVMAQQIHRSRLIEIVPKPVPDLLKPAYNFGGFSLTQLSEVVVTNWLKTRDNVNQLIGNFSTMKWLTNMESVLQGGDGQELFNRVRMFQKMRDTQGVWVGDKSTEELVSDNVPLSNLDKLQAQAQEHMSMVNHIPLVKLTGVTPAGLNASSDGEIRVFYDWIRSEWHAHYELPAMQVLWVMQLDMFGSIDDSIMLQFMPLYELDAVQAAAVRKSNADTDAVYIQQGVLDPQESRDRLNQDPESGYNNLAGEAPGLPEEDEDGDNQE